MPSGHGKSSLRDGEGLLILSLGVKGEGQTQWCKNGLRIELHRVPRDLYCFGSFPSDVISKSENGGGIAGKRIKFGRLFGLDYTLVKSSLGRQGPQRISGSRQNGPRIELKARRNSYSPFDQSQSFNT